MSLLLLNMTLNKEQKFEIKDLNADLKKTMNLFFSNEKILGKDEATHQRFQKSIRIGKKMFEEGKEDAEFIKTKVTQHHTAAVRHATNEDPHFDLVNAVILEQHQNKRKR